MTQPDKIDKILTRASSFIGVSREELTKTCKRSPYSFTKAMLANYLYLNTHLNKRQVATTLGYSNHTTGLYHIKNMSYELGDDVFGSAKTKKCYKELVEYIERESNE